MGIMLGDLCHPVLPYVVIEGEFQFQLRQRSEGGGIYNTDEGGEEGGTVHTVYNSFIYMCHYVITTATLLSPRGRERGEV